VLALPRRFWSEADAEALAASLTAAFRTAGGSQALRPIQALALAELGAYGGALVGAGVGKGKTLVSFLAPRAAGALRPLLLVPANLIGKTRRAFALLAAHWDAPPIRIESYELLGTRKGAALLEEIAPDLIVCDESHRLKSTDAAVTKRVMRYLAEHPTCLLLCMSGTITKDSLLDYAHLLRRCLGRANAPVPIGQTETEEWASALDERGHEFERLLPGALLMLCGPEEADAESPRDAARRAYRRRLVDTPGVIITTDGALGCSLRIAERRVKLAPAVTEALAGLRSRWAMPDGREFMQATEVWAAARQLALGLFYRWDPPAPRAWLDARREWFSACRSILGRNRRNLDSEAQVTDAVREGLYPQAEAALEEWDSIGPTFRPNVVPVWMDFGVVDACAAWTKEGPGIIWTEHVFFARELARRTGLPYYGRKGLDQAGRPIPEFGEPGCGDGVVIASLGNATGRNLQGWCRNLVTSSPANGEQWEQLLGRTHRPLQPADDVTYDLLVTCREHVEAYEKAQRGAAYIEATTGQIQKLSYADCDVKGNDL
jgi:hypothetical protein